MWRTWLHNAAGTMVGEMQSMESLKTQCQKMLRDLRNFGNREEGLVTVEWVALTAAMVVAAVVISYSVMTNTNTQAKTVGTGIANQVTNTYGTNGSKL